LGTGKNTRVSGLEKASTYVSPQNDKVFKEQTRDNEKEKVR